MGDLRGQVAVVTGASRGIGKGSALELGAAGAKVYVTGRTVQEGTAGANWCGQERFARGHLRSDQSGFRQRAARWQGHHPRENAEPPDQSGVSKQRAFPAHECF